MSTHNTPAWLDTQAGKELQSTLSNEDVTASLTQIVKRMDTLEEAVNRLADLLTQGPGMVSMVTDIADESIMLARRQGIDIESRLTNALLLAEKLTAPEMIEKLSGLIEMSNQLPGVLSMVTDILDEGYKEAEGKGIDIESRLTQALSMAEKLTHPEMAAKLEGLIHLADQAPGVIAMMVDIVDEGASELHKNDTISKIGGMFNPKALTILGQLGQALSETQNQPIEKMGPIGAFRALRNPDLQKSTGFLLSFGKNFGKSLNNNS